LYLLAGPIASNVWQSLRNRIITTDLLILAGVIAAYSYSIVSVLRGEGHVYFEVGAVVLVFVSVGRWLEAKGKHRTGTALDTLASLLPALVRRRDEAGQFQEAARESLRTGDTIRVLPGERFPVDGLITLGQAAVDQQIVTGESVQVQKTTGQTVYSGTLNLDGDLQVQVTAADGQETLSRIINMVRTARSVKGRHERLADRITLVFIPVVCLISLGAGWWHGQHYGLDRGILAALSVVLIACPCALGMATPMAVWAALGRAAQAGLLFRSGVVLERLADIRFACFDKTGTLTTGIPEASGFHTPSAVGRHKALQVADMLASGSNHVLSKAIGQFAEQHLDPTAALPATTVETWPGQGLSANVEGVGEVLLGNLEFLNQRGCTLPSELSATTEHATQEQQVYVGWNGTVRGVFSFRESLRPEAAQAIRECQAIGLELHMLSGDHQLRAIPLGDRFGITTAGNLLPEDKVTTLETLKGRGPVAMVGDGLNDAPALAAASVGVALGCGADVSRDAAGVCLLADDLRRFPWAVGLARQTVRIVKQNLFWAFAYNIIGIGMAAAGSLNPIWAALAMALSSFLVIGNSLRLPKYPDLPSWDAASPAANDRSLAPATGEIAPRLLEPSHG
jgi:heavy metal translocating P-type ATPase